MAVVVFLRASGFLVESALLKEYKGLVVVTLLVDSCGKTISTSGLMFRDESSVMSARVHHDPTVSTFVIGVL